jgi:two-component system CheB/CheR fusion protein
MEPEKNGHLNSDSLPIVCICGSAGALKEYQAILHRLPPKTGAAFVIISHLSRKYKSHLVEILSGVTEMPVREAHDGMQLSPNEVVVIPPGMEMAIRGRCLKVVPRSKTSGWSNVADLFLASLAQNRNGKQVAVILSGMGNNGTVALGHFKQAGGSILVQEPGSAEHKDMPHAAIRSGCVDAVLSPAEIAHAIGRLIRRHTETPASRVAAD